MSKPEWLSKEEESGLEAAVSAAPTDRFVSLSHTDNLVMLVLYRDSDAVWQSTPKLQEAFATL